MKRKTALYRLDLDCSGKKYKLDSCLNEPQTEWEYEDKFLDSGSEDGDSEYFLLSKIDDAVTLQFPCKIFYPDCDSNVQPEDELDKIPEWEFNSASEFEKHLQRVKPTSTIQRELARFLSKKLRIAQKKLMPAIESGWEWASRDGKVHRGKTVQSLLSAMHGETMSRTEMIELVGLMMRAHQRHSNSNYDDLLDAGYPRDLAREMIK